MSAILDAFLRRSILTFQKGRALLSLNGMRDERAAPPEGKTVMLERAPHTNSVRITYPDGQTEVLPHSPTIVLELCRRGLSVDKAQAALDYVWNFRHIYVSCERVPAPVHKPVVV